MHGKSLLVALTLLISNHAYATVCGETGDSRPMTLPKKYTTGTVEEVLYAGSYALIIGGVNYQYYAKLDSIADEMDDLTNSLVAQGFKVRKICDPTAAGPGGLDEINKFLDDYDRSDNRIFIYLSGHGWVDKENRRGYYAAVDSPLSDISKSEAIKKGLSSSRLIALTESVKSKHMIIAIDACYSAAIFTQRSDAPIAGTFSSLDFEDISKPSRWFITAGSESEETPSPSIFAPALILGLSGYADSLPADGIVSAPELGAYVRHLVANSSGRTTIPRWGHIPLEAKYMVTGGGQPMFRYDPGYKTTVQQSLKSQGASYLINPGARQVEDSTWPDPAYRITYFEKSIDKGSVIQAMDKANLPYLSTTSFLPQNYRTNGIACHPNAPVEVVKAAARGLIENGIPLRIIDRAGKNLKQRRFQLQVIHYGRVKGNSYRDITIEDLDLLTGCPDEFHFKSQ